MNPRGVAAFDFDGTITHRDTLVPFLLRVGGLRRNLKAWASLAPLVAVRDSASRRLRAKQRMFGQTLAWKPHDELLGEGRAYAAELPPRFRRPTLEAIEWHQEQDHYLVLITASLRLYAEPAALALGFDHVIAVDLATAADGTVTGEIVGPNVRGPEKAARLREHLGADPVELWAYGDSSGDDELLAMADHKTWVR